MCAGVESQFTCLGDKYCDDHFYPGVSNGTFATNPSLRYYQHGMQMGKQKSREIMYLLVPQP